MYCTTPLTDIQLFKKHNPFLINSHLLSSSKQLIIPSLPLPLSLTYKILHIKILRVSTHNLFSGSNFSSALIPTTIQQLSFITPPLLPLFKKHNHFLFNSHLPSPSKHPITIPHSLPSSHTTSTPKHSPPSHFTNSPLLHVYSLLPQVIHLQSINF